MPKMINRNPPKKVICLSEILPAINLPPMTAIAAQIACPNIAPRVTPMGFLLAARAMVAICIPVNLPDRSYNILIEKGSLANLGAEMSRLNLGKKVLLVSNPEIFDYYGHKAVNSLEKAGFAVFTHLIPAGENYKTLDAIAQVYDSALAHRLERLRLARREAVYPDLAAEQLAFCRAASDSLPPVHGVFFAGGDQWRLRQAFVDPRDAANPWLQALRAAHAAGRVVVGGTSAGAAVQSGAWMLGNGSVAGKL